MEIKEKTIKKRAKQVNDVISNLKKVKDDDNIKLLEEKLARAKKRKKLKEQKSIIEIIKDIDKISYSKIASEIFKITSDTELITAIVEMQKAKNQESVDYLENIKEKLQNNEYETVYKMLGLKYEPKKEEEQEKENEETENFDNEFDENNKKETDDLLDEGDYQ
jgi:hypothetical protein